MHPLSVEDLLHRGGHALSKADYYPKHLFIRVLCHTLGSTTCVSQGSETTGGRSAAMSSSPLFTNSPRSASPKRLDEKFRTAGEDAYENGYEDDLNPMADEFETDKATLVDPEIGGRRASFLV